MDDKRKLMEEKVAFLNRAAEAYYQRDEEIISNLEYDRLYDQLQALEKETGIVLSGSPTVRVGYEVVSGLPKERHPSPMLSLDKTKDVTALKDWLGDKAGLLSWKLDGLTIVMSYEGGKLTKAVTRGDGITGEVITNNARVFENIPLTIPEKGPVTVRGEAVISYRDFEKINETIGDADARYKNPRNLCSGTVRQLNNEITAGRHVKFYAFSLAEGKDAQFRHQQFQWMKEQGFVDGGVREGQRRYGGRGSERFPGEDRGLPAAFRWFGSYLRRYRIRQIPGRDGQIPQGFHRFQVEGRDEGDDPQGDTVERIQDRAHQSHRHIRTGGAGRDHRQQSFGPQSEHREGAGAGRRG